MQHPLVTLHRQIKHIQIDSQFDQELIFSFQKLSDKIRTIRGSTGTKTKLHDKTQKDRRVGSAHSKH